MNEPSVARGKNVDCHRWANAGRRWNPLDHSARVCISMVFVVIRKILKFSHLKRDYFQLRQINQTKLPAEQTEELLIRWNIQKECLPSWRLCWCFLWVWILSFHQPMPLSGQSLFIVHQKIKNYRSPKDAITANITVKDTLQGNYQGGEYFSLKSGIIKKMATVEQFGLRRRVERHYRSQNFIIRKW